MNNDFLKGFIDDLRIELMDEFDRNFERKAFFDKPWPSQRMPNRRGSLLMRSGTLRRSLRATSSSMAINFTSSVPYAQIQNDGGSVTVTEKMKRFFWAMYMKSSGAVTYNIRSKSAANTERNKWLSTEASWWKSMALKKVGTVIKVPARQFIGEHPEVDRSVERILDLTMQKVANDLYNQIK